MISFNYNKQKVFLFLIFSLIMISFFLYLFVNPEVITLIKPYNGIHGWVGVVYYKNENLIKITSALILPFFAYSTISLLKKLFAKDIVFKTQNGILFQDNKSLIEISKIKSVELRKINRNYFIYIFLFETQKLIKKDKNTLYKLLNFFGNKSSLRLNIELIKNEPKDTLYKLQKLITKKNTK